MLREEGGGVPCPEKFGREERGCPSVREGGLPPLAPMPASHTLTPEVHRKWCPDSWKCGEVPPAPGERGGGREAGTIMGGGTLHPDIFGEGVGHGQTLARRGTRATPSKSEEGRNRNGSFQGA
jgi:hypothetical protein